MQEKLTYIVEGMLIFTTMASVILAAYVMMTLSNMPY
jgi:hypothetical protein